MVLLLVPQILVLLFLDLQYVHGVSDHVVQTLDHIGVLDQDLNLGLAQISKRVRRL